MAIKNINSIMQQNSLLTHRSLLKAPLKSTFKVFEAELQKGEVELETRILPKVRAKSQSGIKQRVVI